MRANRAMVGLLLVLASAACRVDDAMEDFLPDPEDRTEVFFGGIHEGVRSYWGEYEDLPADLDVLRSRLTHHAVSDVDGWGNELGYTRLERGYCLRSAGSDSVFGTADDVVARGRLHEDGFSQSRVAPEDAERQCRD